jgi:ORF6N domain-containing protein
MICLNQFDQIMNSHRKIANLQSAIHLLRGQRVMLDSDLAMIYGVTTERLNEQLKRNRPRFPADFAFQLTVQEFRNLKSQIATSGLRSQFVTSSSHGGKRKLPWVFTEHGAIRVGRARSPSAPRRTAPRSIPTIKREIGFHVRERSGRYRTKKRF